MFEKFIKFVKGLFAEDNIQDNLEAFIIAGNPQDPGDVDRLEREFYARRQNPREYNYY